MPALEVLSVLADRLSEVPKILVVAAGQESTAVRALASGASGYLVKTARYNELLPSEVGAQIRAAQARRRIVEQKKALGDVEDRFQKAFRASPVAIALTTMDEGRYIDANDSYLRLLDHDRDELIGHTAGELNVWWNLEEEAEQATRLRRSGSLRDFVTLIRTKSGSQRVVSQSVETIDLEGERCILSLLRDVTEEQRTERIRNAIYEISEATSSAKDLQGLFGIIHRSVWELLPSRNFCIELYDPSTDLLSFPYFFDEQEPNPEPYHPGRSLTEYVLQTVLPFLFTPKSFEAMVERGEVEAMGAPGMDWLGVPLTVGSQTIGVLAVQSYTEGTRFTPGDRDILSLMSSQVAIAVERKRGQDALQRTESRFRAVFKRSPIGIALSDLDGRVVESNPALQAMLGCTSEEMRGMSMRDLTHPDDLSRNLDLFGDFDRGARRRTRSWSGMSARIGGCSGGAFPSPFRNPRRLSRHMWSGWWKTSPRNETPSPGRDQHSPSSCPGSTSTDPS